jgi:hypothetical protein
MSVEEVVANAVAPKIKCLRIKMGCPQGDDGYTGFIHDKQSRFQRPLRTQQTLKPDLHAQYLTYKGQRVNVRRYPVDPYQRMLYVQAMALVEIRFSAVARA